jgi:hypothetical protein
LGRFEKLGKVPSAFLGFSLFLVFEGMVPVGFGGVSNLLRLFTVCQCASFSRFCKIDEINHWQLTQKRHSESSITTPEPWHKVLPSPPPNEARKDYLFICAKGLEVW